MKDLLSKLIADKEITRFKIVWHSGIKPEPILAVCKTKNECKQIIKKRQKIWRDSAGYDIISQLEIVSFKYVNELEDK